jgi:hypothetical protein
MVVFFPFSFPLSFASAFILQALTQCLSASFRSSWSYGKLLRFQRGYEQYGDDLKKIHSQYFSGEDPSTTTATLFEVVDLYWRIKHSYLVDDLNLPEGTEPSTIESRLFYPLEPAHVSECVTH